MLGLAAIAAVAAMAFVGASSAMAKLNTQLCNEDDGTLFCKNPTTEVHYVAKDGILLSKVVNVSCLEALLLGNVLALGTAPKAQEVHITKLDYTHCLTASGGACTVKTETLGLLLVLKTAANLADIVDHGTTVRVTCGVLINCLYGGEELTGHGLGATLNPLFPGHVTYFENPVKRVSGFCPETATLDALFISLKDVYIKS